VGIVRRDVSASVISLIGFVIIIELAVMVTLFGDHLDD
jgi:hypothetical protein